MCMVGRKSSQINQYLFLLVIAVVFVGSFFVIFSTVPEKVVARSSDGVVSVEGISRFSNSVNIERLSSNKSDSFMVSPVYSFVLSGKGELKESKIFFNLDNFLNQEISLDKLFIFVYDSTDFEWKELPTFLNLQNNKLGTEFDLFGVHNFVVGKGFQQ